LYGSNQIILGGAAWQRIKAALVEPPKTAHNSAMDAIAFLQRAVDARIDDDWLMKVRAFLKHATAPVA
jgi:hypothetical protein